MGDDLIFARTTIPIMTEKQTLEVVVMNELAKNILVMAIGGIICKGFYESGRNRGIKECKLLVETAVGVANAVTKGDEEES